MSQMANSELVDSNNDNILPLAIHLVIFLTITVIKITITKALSQKNVSSCYNYDWCQKK